MSANIPLDIQKEIINRVVPFKSLIRFRSVSKKWKSLIDNPKFITRHAVHPTHPRHLFITYEVDSERKYVSVVDDDTFPRNVFYHTLPPDFGQFIRLVGCSHGLVCLHFTIGRRPLKKYMLVIWNPYLRKYVSIKLSYTYLSFGFGVCPKTGDPKIVQISGNWKAKVFSLSSRAWRSVPLNMPRGAFIDCKSVVIDGVIYWTYYNNGVGIISFDVTSEEFGKVELPEIPKGYKVTSIYNLNECLVVLCAPTPREAGRRDCYGWKMLKNGASESSFTKLFTVIDHSSPRDCIVGFRKNSQLIIEERLYSVYTSKIDHETIATSWEYEGSVLKGYDQQGLAEAYIEYEGGLLEVHDQQGSAAGDVGFRIRGSNFSMTTYMESLLLFKQTDTLIE